MEKDIKICKWFKSNNECKWGDKCKFLHIKEENSDKNFVKPQNKKRNKKNKNTEDFEPLKRPIDMRVIFDLNRENFTKKLTPRDVVIIPNLFSEFKKGEIYEKLVNEIQSINIDSDKLLKLWHGNEVIPGTHLILNDKTPWKKECDTFTFIVDKIQKYFDMEIKATRLNWYKDTSHFKPFHFDSAAVNPEKAKSQNFTVAASFGISRDCAFQKADDCRNIISFPIGDGEIYCFTNETNCIWRHGVLQDNPIKNEGRISIVCWGKIKM